MCDTLHRARVTFACYPLPVAKQHPPPVLCTVWGTNVACELATALPNRGTVSVDANEKLKDMGASNLSLFAGSDIKNTTRRQGGGGGRTFHTQKKHSTAARTGLVCRSEYTHTRKTALQGAHKQKLWVYVRTLFWLPSNRWPVEVIVVELRRHQRKNSAGNWGKRTE